MAAQPPEAVLAARWRGMAVALRDAGRADMAAVYDACARDLDPGRVGWPPIAPGALSDDELDLLGWTGSPPWPRAGG
jgi:hypothetical protein